MSTADQLIKTYENQLNEFQEWIETQSRLPKNLDKLLLLRHLKVYDFDLEQAKKLLVLNLETRKKHPNVFHNRDVLSPEIQTAMSTMQCMALPYNTKENHKISIFRLVDADPNNFSYVDIIRTILSLLDTRLVYCDGNELINGEVAVIDVSGFGFRHFTKVIANISTMKVYSTYAQEAAPIKIVQNHFINCSTVMEKLLAVIKPFLNKEVVDSLKIHTTLESLHEHVPKNLLPTEYGGSDFSLAELYPQVKEFLEERRDYILNDDNWKIED